MCVGFWSLEHSDYALILCTNRDEYLSRPTMTAQFHSFGSESESDEESKVLSGRDLRAGGTWLGVNRFSGRVALITNITEPSSVMNSSRGYLVSSYLLSDPAVSLDGELERLNRHEDKFAGFNLLLLSPSRRNSQILSYDAALMTNHGAGGAVQSRPISREERLAGGMANGVDGQGGSEWPKVQHGVKSLNEYLRTLPADTNETELTEHLFELLTWRSADPARERSQFKNSIHIDPVPLELGGPPDLYGTRLSTVILIKRTGQVLFVERDVWRMDEDGRVTKTDPPSERVYQFQLPINTIS